QGAEPDAERPERYGTLLVRPPGQGEIIHGTVNKTTSRFAGLLGPRGWPGTRGALGSAGAGCERCNGHGHTPGVPQRAPPGAIWYTSVQTTGAVYVSGTLTQPRVRVFHHERAHAGRCCVCGSLLRRPLFRLPLS